MTHYAFHCRTYAYITLFLLATQLYTYNQSPRHDCSPYNIPQSKIQLPAELLELHKTFRNDPEYYGFLYKENPDPAVIQEFQERFDRAAYALDKMKLKAPLTQLEKEYCYKFGDYLDDPLCHDYLQCISQTADALKLEQMRYFLAILDDRFLFTHIYHHKAKERYEQNGLDDDIRQRTLDMIWQHRYLFATVLHDPILDQLIDHLPSRSEISKKLQEMLIDRLLIMRLKLQDWGFLQYVRDYHVERALYLMDDVSRFNKDLFNIVDCSAIHYSDQEHPHVYTVLFTDKHLLRSLKHDESLLVGIDIPKQLGLREHLRLRVMYEKLLLGTYVSHEQRDAVRLCIRLIVQACVCTKNKTELALIVQQVFDEIQCDDVPEVLLRSQPLLQSLCEGCDEHAEAIAGIVIDLKSSRTDGQEAVKLCTAIGV